MAAASSSKAGRASECCPAHDFELDLENFAWLPASSLSTPSDTVGPETVDCPGVFFQDRPRFHSTIGVGK
jgi:hypothetical protein